MPVYRLPVPARLLLLTCLGLAACQQARPPSLDLDSLQREPPAAGGCVVAAGSDWLSKLPSGQRRVEPAECSAHEGTPLFTWGQAVDRQAGGSYSLSVRRSGGALVASNNNLSVPRTRLAQALPPGDYEWSVSYRQGNGSTASSQWRRFTVLAGDATAQALPEGSRLAAELTARARPRLLPAGSSFPALRQAASQGEHAAVLALLRSRARNAQAAALPANPDRGSAPGAEQLLLDAYDENQRIQLLGLIGRLDDDAALLAQAKRRLLALAAWSATGVSGHQQAAAANRELVQAMAYGLDLVWSELSSAERNQLGSALRARALPAVAALAEIDTTPYELRNQAALRSLLTSLMLASGAPGFPEAASLLAGSWEQALHQLQLWGSDGSMGLGQAPAWHAFNSQVGFAAALRVVAGVDLYRLPALRRAGEQLIAFTPPAWPQRGAFGDDQENTALYAQYAPALYRLHAQLSRDPRDAWYWRADGKQPSQPSDASPWQLLLLGVDTRALPQPQAPTSHDWYSQDAGLAAMHRDIARGERSSLFFRASRFGAHLHAQADQNSLVYVSQGLPLLVNAGYYPRFDSPHHRNTRATRYKNALTVDGGLGQAEPLASKAGEPLFSMDAAGRLIRAQSQDQLAAVTGDASAAYRQFGKDGWQPLLSNAVRSVVMDKANGLVLIYDWATSSQARQWELNFHSPGSISADAATLRVSNGKASACLDRHGPATQHTQTMAWEVPPETVQPAQAHVRFTALARSTEFAHLTVLRDSCRSAAGLQVQRSGTQVRVLLDGKPLAQFDKRNLSLAGDGQLAALPEAVRLTQLVDPKADEPAPGSSAAGTGSTAPATLPVSPEASLPSISSASSGTTVPVAPASLIARLDPATTDFRQQTWSAINCYNRYGSFAAYASDGLHGNALPDGRTQRFGPVNDPLNPQRKVYELRVHKDDPLTASAKRCELIALPTEATAIPQKEVVWFAVSLRIVEGRLTKGEDSLLFQWHASGFNPFLALLLKDGKLRIETRHNNNEPATAANSTLATPWREAQDAPSGWMDFVVQARVSPDPADKPFIRVWRDGKLLFERSGPLGYRTTALASARVGYYQWVNLNSWDNSQATRSLHVSRAILVRDKALSYNEPSLRSALR